MTIYKQISTLSFLGLPFDTPDVKFPDLPDIDIEIEGFKKFLKGLLEGVSSVPFDKNVCYTFPIDIKIEEIKDIFERLYKSIKERNGDDFYKVIQDILQILGKLENANEHCDIKGLIESIGVYSTPYAGIAKLIYNIVSNHSAYYDNIKDAYHRFANKDWENAGNDTGKIISTLLSCYTS